MSEMKNKSRAAIKELKKIIHFVELSGAFDNKFYKSQVEFKGVNPKNFIEHYLTEGWTKGFNPHPRFDTVYYLKNNPDLQSLSIHPFLHFLLHGYREHRKTSANFCLTEYRLQHPELEITDINPLKHYSLHHGKALPALSQEVVKTPEPNEHDIQNLLSKAKSLGLFDFEWYRKTYNPAFSSELDAFKDYLYKSKFSQTNPSPNFDNEYYHRCNPDVYHAQISPLFHYLITGIKERRPHATLTSRWTPATKLIPSRSLTTEAANLRIAICLHIYYEDYIEKFSNSLETFPTHFDLFVTLADDRLQDAAQQAFNRLPNLNKLVLRTVPNRGRNFGPLLVEFSKDLMEYDLFCHLHSKKSLYSGREQTQWSDYLLEYLLNDCSIVRQILNAFVAHQQLGVYYPTTFWMMPSWVNHVTMNKSYMNQWRDMLSLGEFNDFLSYPAGGMFWARPRALRDLLERKYSYDEFPCEPLANDGSSLHALERMIGPICNKNGFTQFFYYPSNGQFTTDEGYITSSYNRTIPSLLQDLRAHTHISFDVFDTLVRRAYTTPDYAKYLLGKDLVATGLIDSANSFVTLRNKAEFLVRQQMNFQGDVSIYDVYEKLASQLNISSHRAAELASKEFEFDLKLISAKDEMVEVFNTLGGLGHILWVISDTYYTRDQIGLILKKAGISAPYRLLVSSAEQKRKDNGSMWDMVKQDLDREGVVRHVHIGDNVVADCQIPGDRGINSIHILHPIDKWKALGFPSLSGYESSTDESQILKWGKLISFVGRVPFI